MEVEKIVTPEVKLKKKSKKKKSSKLKNNHNDEKYTENGVTDTNVDGHLSEKIEELSIKEETSCEPKQTNGVREHTETNEMTTEKLEKPKIVIDYTEYESELQMPDIMQLIQNDLSEPYSIYTYRYFIHNWPKLCFLAMHESKCVGAIVCKLDVHKMVRRGYIAMLAVDKDYRKLKIGTTLVQKAIEVRTYRASKTLFHLTVFVSFQAILRDSADEVVLETEITNRPALKLYENLGFVRDKRLFHYYLNGVDALRLKLWFR